MKGIAVAGSILVDKINRIDGYPDVGKLSQIRKVLKSSGGLVPNVGLDLKAITPDIPVYAYGRVGKDDDGEFILSTLKDGGVSVDNIILSSEPTSFTLVMSVIDGERTFFTYPGASSEFGYQDIDFDLIDAKMFHLGYFLLLDKIDQGDGVKILQKIKEKGITTSIDLVSEQSNRYKEVLPCLPYVDNLIVNELEASGLTRISDLDDLRGMCIKLKELGVRDRVIIHNKDCGVCLRGNEFVYQPSLCLPKGWIKGKTGAGDAFTAGCLTAIYEGMTDQEMLDLGCRCAAVSMTTESATDGMKTKAEIYQLTKGVKNVSKLK